MPSPADPRCQPSRPQSSLAEHSRFYQRLHRRYGNDLPLLPAGAPVQATMTQAGYDLLKKAAPAHVDSVRRVFVDAMTPEDYLALGRAMAAVLAVAD